MQVVMIWMGEGENGGGVVEGSLVVYVGYTEQDDRQVDLYFLAIYTAWCLFSSYETLVHGLHRDGSNLLILQPNRLPCRYI